MPTEVPRAGHKWYVKVATVMKWVFRILVVGLCIFLINVILVKAEQKMFSPAQWEKTKKRERYVYLDDITKNKLHVGMTIVEIAELLGKPDYQAKDGSYITYVVGGSQGLFGFSAVTILDIRLNNGRVEQVLTRED